MFNFKTSGGDYRFLFIDCLVDLVVASATAERGILGSIPNIVLDFFIRNLLLC